MNRITLTENVQDVEANEILNEIRSKFGMIPKLWRAYANYPILLKANWKKQLSVMNSGALSEQLKQAVALIVSVDNSCQYCIDAHKMMLDSMGYDSAKIENNNIESMQLTQEEKLLFDFAIHVNKNAITISDAMFEKMHAIPIENIIEIIGVVELYVGYNLFLNSMKIPGGSL